MKFYQMLMAIAFSVNIGYPYYYILRYIIYFGIFGYILTLIIAPLYLLCEEDDISMKVELILYIMGGILYSSHLIVIVLNKKSIEATYNIIQTSFVNWSVKRGMDPKRAYKKNIQLIKFFVTSWLIFGILIMISPLFSTIADWGELPLDHRSHWNSHWPMVNNLYMYGFIYLLQTIVFTFVMIASLAMKSGFIMLLTELYYQFENLLFGLEHAFNHRIERKFKILFRECVQHHQLIIKYVDNFKSYFKWITFINIFMLQGVISTSLYCIIKVDTQIGYKMKMSALIIIHIAEFIMQCYLGEIILKMHKILAEKVYNMTWYDMPNQHKKLLVIMFQRSQKDLNVNATVFSSQPLSRSSITKASKQIYTLLNVLLKI